MGVESFVGHYNREALCRYSHPRQQWLFLQWGAEEARHGIALDRVLLHSQARSDDELYNYGSQIAGQRWRPSDHYGLDDELGPLVYIMFQERATYVNYLRLRHLIRTDYSLPANSLAEERFRGMEIGASHALRLIAGDEIAHHALFLKIVKTWLDYFPDETIERVHAVNDHFRLPALRLLPNRSHFLEAIKATRIFSTDAYQEQVAKPIFRFLGIPLPRNQGPSNIEPAPSL